MNAQRIAVLASLVAVTLATMFVRVPLPTGGYFNFGDVAVVFGALVVGSMLAKRGWIWGAFVGGVGSALADLLSGYAFFAPITLIAKGLEGAMAAFAAKSSLVLRVIFLAIGGSLMVGTYFVGEYFLPQMGLAAAIAELIPNAVQAVGGAVGGWLLFAIYNVAARPQVQP